MNTIKQHHALSSKVLAVAVIQLTPEGKIFDWACYIDAVNGVNHRIEQEQVARVGQKQNKTIAEILFPHIGIGKYRL